MRTKIFQHLMPWDLDHALIQNTILSNSKKYFNSEIEYHIKLNLSSGIIDWNESKIPKDFFIDKFNVLKKFSWHNISKFEIYDGPELYGLLDFQKDIIDEKCDYYLSMCPDMLFDCHTIPLMVMSAEKIREDYFILTPETYKLWDNSWDVIVNKNYLSAIEDFSSVQPFDVMLDEECYVEKLNHFKYAIWLDLYSKKFIEYLFKIPDGWSGYGPWDLFTLSILNFLKNKKDIPVHQYILKNKIMHDMSYVYNFTGEYKKYLKIKSSASEQRKKIENTFQVEFKNWFDKHKL